MELQAFDRIAPFVRMMRVKQDLASAGKWQDIDHVFTLITSGNADFIVDGIRYSLKKGDVILIPPFQTHVIVPLGKETLAQHILHFDFFEDPKRCGMLHEDVLEQDLPKIVPERERLLNGRVFVASLDSAQFEETVRLYEKMYGEFRELCAGAGCPALLQAYCVQLLVETLRVGSEGREHQIETGAVKSRSWLHIENALAYINAHYADEDLSNECISEAIGVSPNYLTKRFRVCFDMPLHRYVVRLRIEKAQQMLLAGRCNITEAAAATGFSSIHVFSKTFKSVLGMTPSAYMENAADERAVLRYYNDRQQSDRGGHAMASVRPKKDQTGGE